MNNLNLLDEEAPKQAHKTEIDQLNQLYTDNYQAAQDRINAQDELIEGMKQEIEALRQSTSHERARPDDNTSINDYLRHLIHSLMEEQATTMELILSFMYLAELDSICVQKAAITL